MVYTSLWPKCCIRRWGDRGSKTRTLILWPAVHHTKSSYSPGTFCASRCCCGQIKYTINADMNTATACADFLVPTLLLDLPAAQSWIWGRVSQKVRCSAQDDKFYLFRIYLNSSPGEWVTTGSPGQAPVGSDSPCSKQATPAMRCLTSRKNEHPWECDLVFWLYSQAWGWQRETKIPCTKQYSDLIYFFSCMSQSYRK